MGMVFYVHRRAHKHDHSVTTALDLFLYCVFAGAIGARLFHVIYEEPNYYLANPWRVFSFWQGGFVFYGGLISGFFAGWLYLKIVKQSLSLWLDFFTPVLSLGYAIGRWACFLSGCCYGKICDLPWAIGLKQINLENHSAVYVYRHPTPLYSSFAELILLYFILRLEKQRTLSKTPGHLFFYWLGLHSLLRLLMEFLRDDHRGDLLGSMSISSVLSLIFMLVSLFVISRKKSVTLSTP